MVFSTIDAVREPASRPQLSYSPPELDSAPLRRLSPTRLALADIVEGALLWGLWGSLGWEDIRQRYRRSKIGPFWLTISMGVMIGGMGFLYAELFHTEVHSYLPYLAVGVIVWGLISTLVSESCNAFIEAEGIIKQVRLPLSLHIYRVIWRNLIILGHNLAIFVLVALLFQVQISWIALTAIPALLLICVNAIWVGLFWGLLSTRFRDIPQIVASIMQVVFFMTPVMWETSAIPGRGYFLTLNPFYYFLTLVRQPLIEGTADVQLWMVALAITIVGWTAALLTFRRYRWRIAYWL